MRICFKNLVSNVFKPFWKHWRGVLGDGTWQHRYVLIMRNEGHKFKVITNNIKNTEWVILGMYNYI